MQVGFMPILLTSSGVRLKFEKMVGRVLACPPVRFRRAAKLTHDKSVPARRHTLHQLDAGPGRRRKRSNPGACFRSDSDSKKIHRDLNKVEGVEMSRQLVLYHVVRHSVGIRHDHGVCGHVFMPGIHQVLQLSGHAVICREAIARRTQ